MYLAGGRSSRFGCFVTGLALCLLTTLSLQAADEPEATGAQLRGRVLAAAADIVTPIPGVGVQLTHPTWSVPRQTTTDGRGRWSFGDLEPGRYTLIVRVAGFTPYSEQLDLSESGERELDVGLDAAFGQSVTVTATRTRRATEEVAAAISVIGSDPQIVSGTLVPADVGAPMLIAKRSKRSCRTSCRRMPPRA